jgi:hypothetical protein
LIQQKTRLFKTTQFLFTNLELSLGLSYFLPMLKVEHMLIKFLQCQNVFIIKFVDVVKFIKAKLFKLYINPFFCFEDLAFDAFNSLINYFNE